MTEFPPTEEQTAIVDATTADRSNFIINAYAGAAKTSTLVLIAEALPKENILALAFNKAIAVEMTDRFPEYVHSRTLNALGHRIWAATVAPRLQLVKDKTYKLFSEGIKTWAGTEEEQKLLYERMADLMKVFEMGQQCGYVPSGEFPRAAPLMDCGDFFDHLDEQLEVCEQELVRECTITSIQMAFQGQINFNDQIFMPTIFRGQFPRYGTILVDEAQDLSALNHRMLSKLINANKKAPARIIAVGDECQAIYGFRGAHQNSMDLLREEFMMDQYKLTVSFRCPTKVVEHAQWRAPDMKAPAWAKTGLVTTLSTWSVHDLQPQSVVICRNNAPLFSLAIKMIKAGLYPELIGNDVAAQLIKQLKKWKPQKGRTLYAEELKEKILDWRDKQLKRVKRAGPVMDKTACLLLFADQGKTLDKILEYAEDLSRRKGNIRLMTGHKAKGLEFKVVYFLDEYYISNEKQDPNLRYVIQTRSQDELVYILTEDCAENEEGEERIEPYWMKKQGASAETTATANVNV